MALSHHMAEETVIFRAPSLFLLSGPQASEILSIAYTRFCMCTEKFAGDLYRNNIITWQQTIKMIRGQATREHS